MSSNSQSPFRVAIVANNASTLYGGEAFLPFHFFRLLHQKNVDIRLLVHERNRQDLRSVLPEPFFERVIFMPDTFRQKILFKIGQFLPTRIAEFSTMYLISLITEKKQKKLLKRMIRNKELDLIHQCSLVSPRLPSLMYNMGIPCIIGPLNGNMDYPPGFQWKSSFLERVWISSARFLSNFINRLWPGKLKAEALIVANDRTARSLFSDYSGAIFTLIENGIDPKTWSFENTEEETDPPEKPVTFVN